MSFPVGNPITFRFSFTTRVLTPAEEATYVAGGGLPAGLGTDPPKVVFEYEVPGSGVWTVVEGAGVLRDAAGAYHSVVLAEKVGILLWRGVGKDAGGKVLATTPIQETEITNRAPTSGVIASLVQKVLTEGNFDATEPQALDWINQRHKLMVVRAKYLRKRLQIGPTVAGQRAYAIPSEVVEIRELLVNGIPYGNGRHRDLGEGALHFLWLTGLMAGAGGGITARDYDAGGDNLIALYPTPETAGLQIALDCVCRPSDLVTSNDATLRIPPEFTDALVEGAIATGLARVEHRLDLAAPHEQAWAAACAELLKQSNTRYRGPGSAQIRVAGVNA